MVVWSVCFNTVFLLFDIFLTDTDSSRKLREEFAKTCFETLLQFSFIERSKSGEGSITKLAVLSLLQRCQEVVKKYVDDEKLSGKCPLPRYCINVTLLHYKLI